MRHLRGRWALILYFHDAIIMIFGFRCSRHYFSCSASAYRVRLCWWWFYLFLFCFFIKWALDINYRRHLCIRYTPRYGADSIILNLAERPFTLISDICYYCYADWALHDAIIFAAYGYWQCYDASMAAFSAHTAPLRPCFLFWHFHAFHFIDATRRV